MSTQVFERSTSKKQLWNAKLYESNARFVADLAQPAVDLLDIKSGDRILDIGCGDGYLTEKFAQGGASVVGLDFSPELCAAASARGLDIRQGNAEQLDFEDEFTGAFSNAALHWMLKANAVTDGVFRALVDGGRFVGEFAGARNALHIRTAVHAALDKRGVNSASVDPWYLPSAEEYGAVLEGSGFRVTVLSHFSRPVSIDYPIAGWIRTFGSPYLTVLPSDEQESLLQEVSESLRPKLLGADGRWIIDYTRVRFRAEKR